MKKNREIIAGILDEDLEPTVTETTVELNLAQLKFKQLIIAHWLIFYQYFLTFTDKFYYVHLLNIVTTSLAKFPVTQMVKLSQNIIC